MAQTSTALILFFVLIPIFLFLILSVGAIIYRAACDLAGKIVGAFGKQASIPQEYIQNAQAPTKTGELNPFSAPSSYKTPDRPRVNELNPGFGAAMLIVFLTGIAGFAAGFAALYMRMAAARNLSPGDYGMASAFLNFFGLMIQFSLMTTFGKLILNTTWRRASLVTTFFYLIVLAIGLFLGAIPLVAYLLSNR